jgi:hypothetical protein
MSTDWRTLSRQAFLALRYAQPLLLTAPSEWRCTLAPVEAAYSHAALLHISAFLNEAWPPPERDPLAVKASISLREEVREAARVSRLLELQRAQHSRLPSIQARCCCAPSSCCCGRFSMLKTVSVDAWH